MKKIGAKQGLSGKLVEKQIELKTNNKTTQSAAVKLKIFDNGQHPQREVK